MAPRVLRDLAANAGRVVRRASAMSVLPSAGGLWLRLPLSDEMGEFRARRRLGGDVPLGLLDVLRILDAAGRDRRVDGVLLELRGGVDGFGRSLALRRAVDQAREQGLRVVVWADTLDAQGYLVASGADRVFLPPSGSLELVGLRLEQYFLRDLLGKVSVRAEVVHIGRYKSAGEMMTRASMSPEQREQLEAWQGDLFDALAGGIASGRGIDRVVVEALIDDGPYAAGAALEVGLVDALVYRDELERAIEPLLPLPSSERDGPRRVRFVDGSVYHALHVEDAGWRPLVRALPRVAYVAAEGSIQRGGGRRGVASETFDTLLGELRERPEVRGVVLRIDSPGGDAVASDLLHREIERLRREKPVVVSMGDVAASGGYYMAAAADAIFAESGTLTGSIGVVGGKLDLSGLYERVGIVKESVERGARAGMTSDARGFTPDERSAVRREMEAVYETFLERVVEGRPIGRAELERVAEGRVWSGLHAATIGLVDQIGGPLEALADAARRAGLRSGERFVLETHPHGFAFPSLAELLLGGVTRVAHRPRVWLGL